MADYMKFAFMCRERPPSNNIKIAIIGAGPAGLAAAGYLACNGYIIDVYDKQPLPGGLLLFGIPSWRIPRNRVLDGVRELEEKFGVRFVNRTKVYRGAPPREEGEEFVEKSVDLEEVINSYDYVLITTGIWRSKVPKMPGIDAKGVMTALEFLYPYRLEELGLPAHKVRANRVIVIGGGFSAVDAAEQSHRIGADVILAYRRTAREAPAGLFEIERIRKMGVEFMELVAPVEIVVENGVAKGVKFQKMQLGAPDETGRPRPVPIPGSEFVLEADLVILATGEAPTPPLPNDEKAMAELGIKLTKEGTIQVNKLGRTDNPKVFAAGDVVNGPSKVGPAIRSGLYTARYMHNYIQASLLKTPLTPMR